MEEEIDNKDVILIRVPPGDRWTYAPGVLSQKEHPIHPSLTDALEAWYQIAGDTEFYIDARRGIVERISDEVEEEVPVKRFSLYGED